MNPESAEEEKEPLTLVFATGATRQPTPKVCQRFRLLSCAFTSRMHLFDASTAAWDVLVVHAVGNADDAGDVKQDLASVERALQLCLDLGGDEAVTSALATMVARDVNRCLAEKAGAGTHVARLWRSGTHVARLWHSGATHERLRHSGAAHERCRGDADSGSEPGRGNNASKTRIARV